MEEKINIDFDELNSIKECLESLLEDLQTRAKEKLVLILDMFNIKEKNDLIKIQNSLEELSEMDIDFFTRTELLNQIPRLETLLNL